MATAIVLINKEAQRMRKAKPNSDWQDNIQAATRKYHRGELGVATKTKRVGSATKAKPIGKVKKTTKAKAKRPRITGPKKVTRYETTGGGKVAVVDYGRKRGGNTVVKTTTTKLDQGKAIMGKIKKLEAERKTKKHKHEKDFYAIIINGEHAKLKKLAKR